MNLSGKNAIVTGGTRGIGRVIALELAKAGANVVISGRSEETLKKVVEEIKAFGVESSFVQGDVQFLDQAQSFALLLEHHRQ